MPDKIVLRVQSADGTKRIETVPNEKTSAFFEKVYEIFGLSSFNFAIYKERNKSKEVISCGKSLASFGLRHGDIVYLHLLNGANHVTSRNSIMTKTSRSSASSSTAGTSSSTVEDSVDIHLQKQDGHIVRERDERLCHHNQKAKCVHCAPLEPYDDSYLKEQNIKHLSFHSYLRKLTGGADKGKFAALENISCKIRPGCQDHLPWPKGICSKCQPNAITLNRQVYRHVDNVMFENADLVERFLNYWRTTGHQRIGFLYGRYEPHKDVPLGLKATVAAIYEPPQESSRDAIKLLPDPTFDTVNDIARQLGMQRVGWIFTDLVADDVKKGTVKHFRNVTSHFLSAQECIMAGYFQNQNPNPCKLSPDGSFGSKFATVCVTGDSENQVHMEGYQVSNQCMALVQDDCLYPTKDAPELGYIRESSNERYVPDVFYTNKDSYGNEVTQMARPLPIEYLLVDVPVATPMEPQYTFRSAPGIRPFPVENRRIEGHIQDFNALALYLQQCTALQFFDVVSDFHFLIFIASMDTYPLKEYMSSLLDAVKNKEAELVNEWARTDQWATVEQLVAAQQGAGPSGSGSQSTASETTFWKCIHCTFENKLQPNECEMCNLPR